MRSLYQRLVPLAVVRELVEFGVESQYDPYEDKLQNVETFFIWHKEQELTPE